MMRVVPLFAVSQHPQLQGDEEQKKKECSCVSFRISPTLPKKQYTKWAGKRAANRCFPLVVLQRGNGARHVAN